MAKRQILLLSSSNVFGYSYLEYSRKIIEKHLNKNNVKTVLFIPFALKEYDSYTKKVNDVFKNWGYNIEGIHTKSNQIEAVANAEAIFIGGGNSFVLLKALYDNNLINPIRERILNDGIPYIGSSAGTNVATRSIQTTNDMPIVYPPSFDALNLVPFNINPHYIDPKLKDPHQGETREERIQQFLEHNDLPVLALREGTAIHIVDNTINLIGTLNARLFKKDQQPIEYEPGSDLSFLMKQ